MSIKQASFFPASGTVNLLEFYLKTAAIKMAPFLKIVKQQVF
jgi:hypothetical protein